MPLTDILSSIFKGLFDPTALAREMAQENVSPEDLLKQAQKTQQLQTMPTAGAQNNASSAGADRQQAQQPQPFSIGNIMKDLMAPTPTTSQSGQAGSAISGGLGALLQGLQGAGSQLMAPVGSLGQRQQPGMQQGNAQPGSGNSRLSDLMQPATQGQPNVPMAAMAMQPPMPPQLQGLPQQLMQLAPNPANGTPGGNQLPPPLPQAAVANPSVMPQLPAPPQVGVQPPQVRSTMTQPVPVHPGNRAGEMESRGMPGDIRAAISDAAVKYGQDPNI